MTQHGRMSALTTKTSEVAVHDAAAMVRKARMAAGYSLEALATATGLTKAEIESIESGVDDDHGRLQRCVLVLKAALGVETF